MFAVHTPPSMLSRVVGRSPAHSGARGSKPCGGETWEGGAETEADGLAEIVGEGGALGTAEDATGLVDATVDEGDESTSSPPVAVGATSLATARPGVAGGRSVCVA
jgi:hypothetical protein